MTNTKILRSVGLAAILGALAACDESARQKLAAVPADEASTPTWSSDEAFVRRVVPALLGRQVLGSNEVYALLEILKVSSRAKVVDLLLARPELSEYWASVLLEDLKPDVAGSWTPPQLAYPNCLTTEWLGANNGARIEAATWITQRPYSQPFVYSKTGVAMAFTMRDLVKGAILGDKLQAIYPAWIVLLTSTQALKANEVSAIMMDSLMNRKHDCMGCHTSTGSPTERPSDEPGDPNRHFPRTMSGAVVDLEGSVFGYLPDGQRRFGGFWGSELGGFFTKDAPSHGASPIANDVWGLYCTDPIAPDASNTAASHFAGHDGPGLGTPAIVSMFLQGVTKLSTQNIQFDSETGLADPEAAFAYLIATNVVDNVYEELTGSRLTLKSGFSRTADQQFMHSALTAAFLGDKLSTTGAVESGGSWSLKALLKAMVLDNKLFNRKAPASSAYADKYQLPMIANPWVLSGNAPNAATGADANGQGDLVNRRSAVALFMAASRANGTSGPIAAVAGLGGYPSFDAAGELGAHVNGGQPANRTVNLNAMMAWASRPEPGAGTWATRLDTQLKATWNASGVSTRFRYNDLAIAIKDRVLGQPTLDATTVDPTLNATESALVRQMLTTVANPIASMNDFVAKAWWDGDGKGKLMKYMAMLEETPQFLLSGLPPTESLPQSYPDPTRLDVCATGEPCSITTWIVNYGYTQPILTCTPGGVATGAGTGSGAGSGSGCTSGASVNGKNCYCDSACLTRKDCCFDKIDRCP